MKKKFIYIILLIIVPILLCGWLTSRFGPWWGFREQANTPSAPSNGYKIWCDTSNDIFAMNDSGTNYQLNVYDPNNGLTDPTSIGTLTLASGSITDSSGDISFDNENLTTTGFLYSEYFYHSANDADTGIRLRADRISCYAGARVMIDAIEGADDSLNLGYEDAVDIDVNIGPNAAIAVAGDTGIVTLQNYLRTATSKWYYCKYVDAFSVSAGGSGATFTAPDPNILGGYLLDNATEYLYFNAKACSNWDGASDITVHITFETNSDNSGGNGTDTVDLNLVSYFKGDTDVVTKSQTIEEANVIGTAAKYKQFTSTHTIDYDDPNDTVDTNDIFSFRLNLETDTSEVDSIYINFIVFRYQTKKVHVEI